MNSERFVEIVKEVRDAAIEDTFSFFEKPPGKKPRKSHIETSQWLNALDAEDKLMLRELVKEGIDYSLFGLLCAFDGVRKVESGEFKLTYIEDDKESLLNDPDTEDLHDLYNYFIQNEHSD